MPAISIITPLYNKKDYISSMMDCVLKQSFSDFEIIIIDDGSTDGSGQIADYYAMKDTRVRVVHIANGGVSRARNTGLDLAKGKYITFIDADDTVSANYVEKLYRCLIDNEVDIVISGITKVWEESSQYKSIIPPYQGKKNLSEVLCEFAEVQKLTGIYGFCVSKMFPHSILGSTRFDERLHLAEDFDFYLNIYRKVTSIFFSNDASYFYLQEAENSPLLVEDSKIDYFSQVIIQLHFADYLNELGYYNGINRTIIEDSIKKYVYLTLHFATRDTYNEKFLNLHEIYRHSDLSVSGQKIRQKVCLFLLKHNMRHVLWTLIQWYWKTRELVRG